MPYHDILYYNRACAASSDKRFQWLLSMITFKKLLPTITFQKVTFNDYFQKVTWKGNDSFQWLLSKSYFQLLLFKRLSQTSTYNKTCSTYKQQILPNYFQNTYKYITAKFKHLPAKNYWGKLPWGFLGNWRLSPLKDKTLAEPTPEKKVLIQKLAVYIEWC